METEEIIQKLVKNYQIAERAYDVFNVFKSVFEDDTRFKIIETLSKREGANLRELARRVGITHKNLAKYLKELTSIDVIDSYPVGRRIKVYRLSKNCEFLRNIFNGVEANQKKEMDDINVRDLKK